ncbi:GGDEF domain-containing protein [Comamonas guangdongensis]|uniref:diguanylate cyclase n=2 Tax=Comamonas guangdongensis TaxID=510515 RepID=A0ABV3ZXW6_9BURK
MTMVLWGVRRNLPVAMPGVPAWSMAPLLCAASTVFFSLDQRLPGFVVMLAGNALLMSGLGLFYFGSLRFWHQSCPWRSWTAGGAALLAAMSYFYCFQPDFRARTMLFAGSMAVCAFAHARLLQRHGKGFSCRLSVIVLATLCGVSMLRAATTFWLDAPDSTRVMQMPMQQLYAVSFHLAALLLSIGGLLMLSERVRYEFEHQASHDSLTGAFTRRTLFQAGEREWTRWTRYGRPFSVLLLDIDRFKSINDRWGHPTGDKVLQECTTLIAALLRSGDALGRYGGEEFVVVLGETDGAAAWMAAERIRQALEQHRAPDLPAYTASIGVATAAAGDTGFGNLLKRADMALYQAKASGRNRSIAL